ncbi:MAG: DNA-formamidopyrimidine glycosylase [Bacilli bacterium]
MPELPEVETVVKTLRTLILDKEIIKVDVFWDNIIDKIDVTSFKKQIVGQKIVGILRKGKIIIFELSDYYLLSHLRMEGKYYVDQEYTQDKHSHVQFHFSDGTFLRYHDTRKFGKMSLVKKEDLLNHPYLLKIGPEPFDIDVKELHHKLKRKHIEIKPALLDQSIMAGLGNIYVDEVLFLSKIHPTKKADSITLKQAQLIVDNAIITLNKAIELGGTTIRSYTSSLGVSGRFQNELLVHTKKDEPCPTCLAPISKIKVKTRGTYVCHHCQKK